MDSTTIIAQLEALAATDAGGIGRYEGWHLVTDKQAIEWIRGGEYLAKDKMKAKNIHLVRWSSVSLDPYDDCDFAIRLGIRSI
jgi:hypothetical protein